MTKGGKDITVEYSLLLVFLIGRGGGVFVDNDGRASARSSFVPRVSIIPKLTTADKQHFRDNAAVSSRPPAQISSRRAVLNKIVSQCAEKFTAHVLLVRRLSIFPPTTLPGVLEAKRTAGRAVTDEVVTHHSREWPVPVIVWMQTAQRDASSPGCRMGLFRHQGTWRRPHRSMRSAETVRGHKNRFPQGLSTRPTAAIVVFGTFNEGERSRGPPGKTKPGQMTVTQRMGGPPRLAFRVRCVGPRSRSPRPSCPDKTNLACRSMVTARPRMNLEFVRRTIKSQGTTRSMPPNPRGNDVWSKLGLG